MTQHSPASGGLFSGLFSGSGRRKTPNPASEPDPHAERTLDILINCPAQGLYDDLLQALQVIRKRHDLVLDAKITKGDACPRCSDTIR